VSKRSSSTVIWPIYLDSTKSRSKGRRIPRNIAVESPQVEEILEACKELSLNPSLEAGKKHPSAWGDKPGRVVIAKKGKKLQTLKEISAAIIRRRKLRKQ